jgi:putative endonuclease
MRLLVGSSLFDKLILQYVWKADPRLLGQFGETLALRLLEKEGYHIWKKNWSCRAGEIDIIAYSNRELAFVEVKTRLITGGLGFDPVLAVDELKQDKLISLAEVFMCDFRSEIKRRRIRAFRFDIIAVYISPVGKAIVRHLPGAFNFEKERESNPAQQL